MLFGMGGFRASVLRRFSIVGPDCVIMGGLQIRSPHGLRIGSRLFANCNLFIQASGTVTIGDDVLIGPNVSILSENHRFDRVDVPINQQGYDRKPISVGNDVWLGAGCIILAGVSIGDGAIVAAGAVVTRDVEPYWIVAGVPAKPIRVREASEHSISLPPPAEAPVEMRNSTCL